MEVVAEEVQGGGEKVGWTKYILSPKKYIKPQKYKGACKINCKPKKLALDTPTPHSLTLKVEISWGSPCLVSRLTWSGSGNLVRFPRLTWTWESGMGLGSWLGFTKMLLNLLGETGLQGGRTSTSVSEMVQVWIIFICTRLLDLSAQCVHWAVKIPRSCLRLDWA